MVWFAGAVSGATTAVRTAATGPVAAVGPTANATPAATGLDGLVEDSPFIARSDAQGVTTDAPVEFRGVIDTGKDAKGNDIIYLGFYDRLTHNTYWMRSDGKDNDPANPNGLWIVSYDVVNDQANIKFNRRPYDNIPLATARISIVQQANATARAGEIGRAHV